MAQSISFGVYTIQLDGNKLSVLDHNGHVVATAELAADATAKIPLPNGQVLDMGQLADALSSDHIADFATAAGGTGGGNGAAGSGMFFSSSHHHNLAGFDELAALKPTTLAISPAPQDQSQQPITSFAHQNNGTTPPSPPVSEPPANEPPANEPPVNHAPVVNDQALTTAEDTPLASHVTGTDVDGDNLDYQLITGPAHGTVVFNSNGTFTYTPNGDYHGADGFTYKANDGNADSQPATVSLTVTPVNDAPVATNEALTTAEDTVLHGSVTATDVDGDHLSYSLIDGPQHGTVTFNSDGTFVYTPSGDYNGADSFTYKANDGSADSQPATVSLTVTPVNDAPVATNEALTTAEDTILHGSVTATDAGGDHLSYSLIDGPQHGTVTFNSDGTFVYTPSGDYNGADSFTYKANDGSADSQPATVSLTVTPVNDAPVATNEALTTAEDTILHGSVTATDVDGDHLSYSLIDAPQHGTVTFNSDGTFVYTPSGNYNGADSFTYKANDGSADSQPATVSLTVTPVNDAPAANNATMSTPEDTAVHGHVTATDVDGDALTYRLVNGPQHGTVTFNSDGSYVYTPGADYNGADSFTYKANDGTVDSQAASVSLTITPVNDAPVAANATATGTEDTSIQSHVTATDVDGDHLSYSLVNAPQHGAVTFNADGTFIYTPNANYNGTDSFTYRASDGNLNSNTASVNLTITPVNDAPTISVDSSVTENHFIQLTQSQNPLGSTTVGDYLLHPTEGKAITDTSMINGIDPSNISLAYQAPVTVSFVAEGAGNHNMVGVYSFDSSGNVVPGSIQFLWLDASATSDNTLGASLVQDFLGNTQQHDISLGTLQAGTNLGFFMISNGANSSTDQAMLKAVAGVDSKGDNDASDLAAINGKLGVSFDSNGNGHITVNGVAMSGDTYFSSNKVWNTDANSNDIQHVISGVTSTNDGKLYIGFEDLAGGGDKDYNDVVFNVDIGDYNINKASTATVQPNVQIGDIDSTSLSSATVDTHGFVSGDALHVPPSSEFDVSVTQNGYDYHISISAHAGTSSVADFQSYLNSIYFTSSSGHEGARTLDYTVTDDQHATSSVAEGTITVHSSYDISASTLTASQTSLGSGDDHLHLDAALTHNLDMGAGDNTVSLEQNNGSFGHSQAQYLQNVDHLDTTGFGTNTVSLSISDVLEMTDGGHQLTIIGDAADSVKLNTDGSGNHWQQTGSHDGFNVYTWSDPTHQAVVEISTLMHQTAH